MDPQKQGLVPTVKQDIDDGDNKKVKFTTWWYLICTRVTCTGWQHTTPIHSQDVAKPRPRGARGRWGMGVPSSRI